MKHVMHCECGDVVVVGKLAQMLIKDGLKGYCAKLGRRAVIK